MKRPLHDGLPDCLEDWIPYSGVTALKIKLNGGDLAADVDRVAAIDRHLVHPQKLRRWH